MNKSHLMVSVVVLAVLGSGCPLYAKDQDGSLELAEKVALRYFDFVGYDDPKMTLAEGIDQIQKRHDVFITVNEKAFAADKVGEVLKCEIAQPNALGPIPKATLEIVLNKILNRIPAESGAMFVIRDGTIELTTRKAAREELGRKPDEPIPPLVYIRFDNLPLEKALELISQRAGLTLVLDPKVGDKGKAPISALFKSVPVDSVVRVLTDMAGLKPVRIDNMIYVTTAENAKLMSKN